MPKRPPYTTLKARRAAPPSGRIRVASGAYSLSPSDAFRAKPPPTPVQLVQAYRYAAYVCANLNATAVASQSLRLYVTTTAGKGQKAARCRTKALGRDRERRLETNPGVMKRLVGVDKVEEVTESPVLDLFAEVNPWLDQFQLMELTQLYREIDGRDFWYLVKGAGDRPVEIWPLPSWMVYVQPDYSGTDVVKNYVFTGGGGQAPLDRGDVLFGRELSLVDPYVGSLSPLRANYELAQIFDKQIDYRDSTLTNRGRPDAMLVSKDEGAGLSDPDAIVRIQAEYEQQYTRGRAGRLYVPPGGLDLKPINWSPTDMGEIALSKGVLHDVARGFGVPIPLVDGESANRANLDAALLQHARFAIKPRCRRLEEHWTSNLLPRWDDSGRLFFAFDDCVPADKVLERETNVAYAKAGIRSINAIRAEIGDEPAEGGDEPLVDPNLVPLSRLGEMADAKARQSAAAADTAENPPDPDESETEGQEEREDEEFEEGQDVEGEGESKALGGERDRRPFAGGRAKFNQDAPADAVPRAHAILARALKRRNLSHAYLSGTLTPAQRLAVLGGVRREARAWLRREAQRVLDEVGRSESKALFGGVAARVGAFFDRAKRYLREAVVAGVLAVSGPDPASAAEMHAVERSLAAQVVYLDNFRREVVEERKPIDRAFVARAEQYGAAVWGAAQEAERAGKIEAGVATEERRVLGAAEHCSDCPPLAALGWQPIGTLPPIGSTECRGHCRCRFEYRVAPEAGEVLNVRATPASADFPAKILARNANTLGAPRAKFNHNHDAHSGEFSSGHGGAGGGAGEAEGDKAKFVGEKVGKSEHLYAETQEKAIAKAVGGTQLKDNEPLDVRVPREGGGEHAVEVKSMLKGSKAAISVHDDALLRKVEYARSNPGATFHTVVMDHRNTYEGGKHSANYSGHDLYYKRGSGRYSLSQMHPVKDHAELKRLMETPDRKLPAKAKGALPKGKAVARLRKSAAKAHDSRLRKDRARKRRIRESAQEKP